MVKKGMYQMLKLKKMLMLKLIKKSKKVKMKVRMKVKMKKTMKKMKKKMKIKKIDDAGKQKLLFKNVKYISTIICINNWND